MRERERECELLKFLRKKKNGISLSVFLDCFKRGKATMIINK